MYTSVPSNSRTSSSLQRRPGTHWQPLPNFSPSSLWWTLNPFLSLWICLLWTFHTNGMVQHAAFCVRLLLLNIMFSRFLHIVSCISTSLLLMTDSIVWIFHIFIYQLMNKWIVSSFGLLWIMVIWNFVYTFLCVHIFSVL